MKASLAVGTEGLAFRAVDPRRADSLSVATEFLASRLSAGRPLTIDSDTCAAFRARGVALDTPGAVGELLRRDPGRVRSHYQDEVRSEVSVLCALTADTSPRSLAEVGMEHRSAALTGLSLELALEVAEQAKRPVAVAGVLGCELVGPVAKARAEKETRQHALRIVTAGAELLVVRGQGSRRSLGMALKASEGLGCPVWAVLECGLSDEAELFEVVATARPGVVLLEVASVRAGIEALGKYQSRLAAIDSAVGVLVAARPDSVRGFPARAGDLTAWSAGAKALADAGARVIGGGAGTTEAHTRAFATELRVLHPSAPPPPA